MRRLFGRNKDKGKDSRIDSADQSGTEESNSAPTKTQLENGYGISILYTPVKPEVDIVFIHGVTGKQFSTWTADGASKPWPEAFLAEDTPNARISAFGYDADVVNFFGPAGQNRIRHHARDFLKGIADMWLETGIEGLPIIIVAHSMGGLVCQNALVLANNAEQHEKNILDCTKAVAFLGTPHRGSDAASWAVIAGNMLNVVKRSNKDIVQVLHPDSEVLENLTQDFHTMLRARELSKLSGIEITCFVEQLPMTRAGKSMMIVPSKSATLDRYPYATIHADHSSMTKFKDRSNDYKSVANQIKRWIKQIEPVDQIAKLTMSEEVSVRDRSQSRAVTPSQLPLPEETAVPESFTFRTILPPQAQNYVARPEETAYLVNKVLNSTKDLKVFTIHGLGGAGKTQLMINYARKYRKEYTAVFWLNGSSLEAFRRSFLAVFQAVSSPLIQAIVKALLSAESNSVKHEADFQTIEDLITAAINWLNLDTNTKWLMLIDNVDRQPSEDDPQSYDIFAYMNRLNHGSVIITTRYRPLCRPPMSITLEMMDENQALQVLADGTGSSVTELPLEAIDLVHALGYLPLALSQASACIFQESLTFTQYLASYKSEWLKRMGSTNNGSVDNHSSVATTWVVSYNFIEKRYPLSATFLHILAYFDCSDIAYELFKVDLDADMEENLQIWPEPPPELVTQIYAREGFMELIQPLVSFSFLYPQDPGKGGYKMHPLVQEWCIASTPGNTMPFSLTTNILYGSARLSCQDEKSASNASIRSRLCLHVSRCMEFLPQDLDFSTLTEKKSLLIAFFFFGKLYATNYDYNQARKWLKQAFHGLKYTEGTKNHMTRACAVSFVDVMVKLKQYEEAENVIQEILDSTEDGLNRLSEEELRLKFIFAVNLGMMERTSDADILFKVVMEQIIKFQVDADALPSDYEVQYARFLRDSHRETDGLHYCQDVLSKDEHWTKLDKTFRWEMFEMLTQFRLDKGKNTEAIRELEIFIDRWADVYGFEDLGLFEIQLKLAKTYWSLQMWSKCEAVLKGLQRDFPNADSHKVFDYLGRCMEVMKDYDGAATMFEKVLAARIERTGRDAIPACEARVSLASVYQAQGRLSEAEKLLKQSAEVNENELDPRGTLSAGSLSFMRFYFKVCLAEFFRQTGRLQDCRSILGQTLKIIQTGSGTKTWQLVSLFDMTGKLDLEEGNYDAAEAVLRNGYNLRPGLSESERQATIYVVFQLARSLGYLRRFEESAGFFEEYLSLTTDEASIMDTLEKLGYMYFACGKYAEAIKNYERAIELKERTNQDSDETMNLVMELAGLHRDQENYEVAEDLFRRAYETYSDENSKLKAMLELGLCYLCQREQFPSKVSLAVILLEKCYMRCKEVGDPDSVGYAEQGLIEAYYEEKKYESANEIINMVGILSALEMSQTYLVIILTWQSKIYWQMKDLDQATMAYCRLVSIDFLRNGGDISVNERSNLIRAGVDDEDLVKCISLWYQAERQGTRYVLSSEYGTCNQCERALTTDFHVCCNCWDMDLCQDCFGLVNDGKASVCDRQHKFLDISWNIWKEDDADFIDDQGVTAEIWMTRFRRRFLDQMRLTDDEWMTWLSKISRQWE